MRIPDSIIEQLNSQADLVGMIRKHTVLKPAGREFKGCCPFHGEKTPSFYVNPETNLYYCFGCHAKGNPITFLKEFERLSFIEAVKTLSEQTGIELPKDDEFAKKVKYNKTKKTPKNQQQPSAQPVPPPMPQAPSVQTAPVMDDAISPQDSTPQVYPTPPMAQPNPQGDLYQLLENICHFYQFTLQNTPVARQYFLDRGVSESSIQTFRLGYAPDGWQHLEEVFSEDIEGLKILGLVRQSQNGRDYDLLRNRVIFPIRDKQGRVVGFAGRTIGDDSPKYINSSESPVFQKQHILYGLYESRQQKASDYMMVEGYMDVIALYQAGIYGAVAPMGTAANENQIATLLRYNNTLTLCFDGDNAGQRAAWRTMEIAAPALEDGKTLKFLTLPDQHDPDTFIAEQGADAMREQILNAWSLSDYIYQILAARFDLEKSEQKAAAMAELRKFTDLFPKGSSYKWLLNSDIYQRIKSIGDTRFGRRARMDTINYQAGKTLDTATELALFIMQSPTILDQDPLADIISQSQMADAHHPYSQHLERQSLKVPDLPTWQSLDSAVLTEVITAIKALPNEYRQPNNDVPNHSMYFILSTLSEDARQQISAHWDDFVQIRRTYPMDDITPLVYELICTALKKVLSEQQKNAKVLALSMIYKQRLQLLTQWDNQNNKAKLADLFNKS